jgi:hypothetical protein
MSSINKLSRVSKIAAGDLIPISSGGLGGDAVASIQTFADYVADQVDTASGIPNDASVTSAKLAPDLASTINQKQNALTAGTNITISGNTISASGGGGGSTVTPTAFSSAIDFRSNKAMPVAGYYQQAGAIGFTKDATGAIEDYGTTIRILADGSGITFSGFDPLGAVDLPTSGQKAAISFVNSGGVAFYSVGLGAAVAPAVPVNSTAPTISGTTTQGQTLTATTGTWTNTPTSYAYQWRRGGTAISGATSSTYALVSADVGTVITVAVIATNAGGSSTAAVSAGTATIAAPATPVPVNSVAPAISGTAQVGQTLTVSNGTWSNTPTSYAYQWKRAGTNISGATAQTYVPVTADVGNTLTCAVTASNAGGAGTAATSAATSAVTAASLPTVSDNFNRADSSTSAGTGWTNINTSVAGISGNKMYFSTATPGEQPWGGNWMECGYPNGTIEADITLDPYFLKEGIVFRRIDDSNGLFAWIQEDQLQIYSVEGGARRLVKSFNTGTSSFPKSSVQHAKVTMSASAISFQVGSVTVTAVAADFAAVPNATGGTVSMNASATKHGFYDGGNTLGLYDNFLFTPA